MCVDRTHNVGDELWLVLAIGNWRLAIVKSRPCWVDGELLVLATAVHRSVVLVDTGLNSIMNKYAGAGEHKYSEQALNNVAILKLTVEEFCCKAHKA